MPIFGCIADDFTGASDAASFLVKGGMSVRLYNGIPDSLPSAAGQEQAIVIALKSRTQDTAEAVRDTLAAARWLLDSGVRHLYFKYCSTFDSTPQGNIGPVADALMELTGSPYSILCPALPVNGRIVKDGHLYVNGVPLHESPMKNHPLTPMWDSNIANLMKPQSKYPCHINTMPESPETPFYLIPDYEQPEDGESIAQRFWQLPLLTGGSGLLEPLARIHCAQDSEIGYIPNSQTEGNALLVAGSCSAATLSQIDWYKSQGLPTYKIDPIQLMNKELTTEEIWQYIREHTTKDQSVLVYTSDRPEKVKEYQAKGMHIVASLLEDTLAELAWMAVDHGFTRIISAGGETSGAVTRRLHYSSYIIGESVAPGVPIMVPTDSRNIRLILKSGNFGQQDFFGRALNMTAEEER